MQYYSFANHYLISSTYVKYNNNYSVYHKTKGIPIDMSSGSPGRVFERISSFILERQNNHYYKIKQKKPSRFAFHNSQLLYSLQFDYDKDIHSICSLRYTNHITKKKYTYTISRINKRDCQFDNCLPIVTNDTTLIVSKNKSVVFVITRGKHELFFSFFNEISSLVACFLLQALIFEGMLVFCVYWQNSEFHNLVSFFIVFL